jgi:ribosomal-protein-alanine N-acetyltransferase
MTYYISIKTERLSIEPLTTDDHTFIRELVNSQGWLQFIGNRNINSDEDAIAYIERILNSATIDYWVVRVSDSKEPVGMVSLVKRDYLPQPDIGFAFLPIHMNKGYAYEATKAVMDKLKELKLFDNFFAITIPGNVSSIRLLDKLGLKFEKQIEVNEEKLQLYQI